MSLPTLTARQLAALRACHLYPQGMRLGAHPSTMPGLQDLGLVELRPAHGPGRKIAAWFITAAGRACLAAIDGKSRMPRRGTVD